MKLANLIGERFKETPSDCIIESHALMLRGGYMKYVANGIYSSLPPLRRITKKIEQIIREEMDALDGQEVQFPVVLPASLWQESGRYESVRAAAPEGPKWFPAGAGNDARGSGRAACQGLWLHLQPLSLYDLPDPDQIPG